MFKASVKWIGVRHDGSSWKPLTGLRPQIRFPAVAELNGIGTLWDAYVAEVISYDKTSNESKLLFSMNAEAPLEKVVPGIAFEFADGDRVIAVGEVE